MVAVCNRYFLLICGLLFCFGCATPEQNLRLNKETASQQLDAAQKVVGGMAGREISREELLRVGQDMQKNEESRSAVRKIIGANGTVKVKYSPVTGKHYSGDLEFDPETGVKLEVLEE